MGPISPGVLTAEPTIWALSCDSMQGRGGKAFQLALPWTQNVSCHSRYLDHLQCTATLHYPQTTSSPQPIAEILKERPGGYSRNAGCQSCAPYTKSESVSGIAPNQHWQWYTYPLLQRWYIPYISPRNGTVSTQPVGG